MFIIWIVVMVTQVYTDFQSHNIVYINYMQFSVYKLYLNKPGGEKSWSLFFKVTKNVQIFKKKRVIAYGNLPRLSAI